MLNIYDIHLLNNWIILLKILEFICLRSWTEVLLVRISLIISYDYVSFFCCQSCGTFLHPTISPWPPGQRLCRLRVISHFQGAILGTSSCWACCNVCLLLWTAPRLLCPLALSKAASATWHLCRFSDLDVAEQVDNQEKKKKTFANISFVSK